MTSDLNNFFFCTNCRRVYSWDEIHKGQCWGHTFTQPITEAQIKKWKRKQRYKNVKSI